MAAKKGVIRVQASSRIIAKILLLLVLYLAVLCVPLLAKDAVITAYNNFDVNTPLDVAYVPNSLFNMLFNGFVMLIGGLFIVNLFFRLIDESQNDTVLGRHTLHVVLNVLIILGGTLYLLYLNYLQIQSEPWWIFSSLAENGAGNALLWGWAALYLVCATILSILDLRVFAGENRSPEYRRNRLKKQDVI